MRKSPRHTLLETAPASSASCPAPHSTGAQPRCPYTATERPAPPETGSATPAASRPAVRRSCFDPLAEVPNPNAASYSRPLGLGPLPVEAVDRPSDGIHSTLGQ